MLDGRFRNCDLPKHWKKACQTLINPAALEAERLDAVLRAFKKDSKLPTVLCSPPYNLDLFDAEKLESLACSPETTDFGREVLRMLRFGDLNPQAAVEEATRAWLDAICRKVESICNHGEAKIIRQSFVWVKSEIDQLEVARKLCQSGKFDIPVSTPFDIDAHLQ